MESRKRHAEGDAHFQHVYRNFPLHVFSQKFNELFTLHKFLLPAIVRTLPLGDNNISGCLKSLVVLMITTFCFQSKWTTYFTNLAVSTTTLWMYLTWSILETGIFPFFLNCIFLCNWQTRTLLHCQMLFFG